jgi:hypothetical protein
MLPEMEQRIRSVFKVEHFLSTGYTSNETGAIGFQCRHLPSSHFHVHENMQHVSLSPLLPTDHYNHHHHHHHHQEQEEQQQEQKQQGVVSPRLLGEKGVVAGKIVATNLNRTLMPLIKYEIGDMGYFVGNINTTPTTTTADAAASTYTSGIGVSGSEGGGGGDQQCLCGRRLRVLRLLGRCDDRVRLGAEDVRLEEVTGCVQRVRGVSLVYSLHLRKSLPRQFDHVTVHVEATSRAGAEDEAECARIRHDLLHELGRRTQLVWEVAKEEGREDDDDEEEEEVAKEEEDEVAKEEDKEEEREEEEREEEEEEERVFEQMMAEKARRSEGRIEVPVVQVHAPNSLPRNPRTGKIALLVDNR